MGVPVQRLRQEISSFDFVIYQALLRKMMNEHENIEHQLAGIHAELLRMERRRNGKSGRGIKDKKFLVVRKAVRREPLDKAAHIRESKRGWLAAFGMLDQAEEFQDEPA